VPEERKPTAKTLRSSDLLLEDQFPRIRLPSPVNRACGNFARLCGTLIRGRLLRQPRQTHKIWN